MTSNEDTAKQALEREHRRRFRWWRFRSLPRRCWRELTRILRAATRAAGLFFTIVGALLSVVAFGFHLLGQPHPSMGARLGIVLGALVVAFVGSGLLVLRMLPADELARFLIDGRRTSEILETIALRIHRLARKFLQETGSGQDIPDRLLEACKSRSRDRTLLIAEAEKKVDAIDSLLRAQDINFRRIEALKRVAATELGVSQRSLGDHILQFSPAMFRVGVTKYLRNLREMIELTRADFEPADARRMEGLKKQNGRLEADCQNRATIQELLLRFEDLHADICSLASTRSTSGSLQAYSRALAGLATRQSALLKARWWRRGWRRWSGSVEDATYIETYERFLFLSRRQRAHPGFDLHTLLTQAIVRMSAEPPSADSKPDPHDLAAHFDQGTVKKLAIAMRALDWRSQRLGRDAPLGKDVEDPEHVERYLARLTAMREVHRYFNRVVGLSREAMYAPFRELLEAWCEGLLSEATAYIVTLGYSKTVRELIRYSFGSEPNGEASAAPPVRPQVYQLVSGDPDGLDARLMAWELRDLRPLRLAAGSGQMLVSMTRPGDRVLVLLGAEAVDKSGRVVHPRSVLEQLILAADCLNEARISSLVVVAAESFKCHGEVFASGPLYGGYLERVGIYSAPLVHLILTEKGTKPGNWKRVVQQHLLVERVSRRAGAG